MSIDKSKPENDVSNESSSLPTSDQPSTKSSGCFLKAILALVVLAIVLLVVQRIITPDVNVGDEQALTIRESKTDQNSDSEDRQNADNIQGAPARITDALSNEAIANAEHPLDPLMELADASLKIIDEKYADYSSKMLAQVETKGTLNPERLMLVKIRHARSADPAASDQVEDEQQGEAKEVPFSIYTRFLKPKSMVGQEAIWVDGKNEGLILGHGTGLLNIKTVRLPPDGAFAMRGNRYPIYQIGFRNLIVKMKEFGDNDRQYDECEVQIDRDLEVDGRKCTRLTITHPVKRDHFDYHIAKIYIDDVYEIPTGYEGYLWPEKPGDDPPLLEKYFYTDLQLNCGLTEMDFDIANPEYDFPAW